MSSFALWFDKCTTNPAEDFADVHFNLWNLHYRKAQPPCLDVGIKIKKPNNFSKIYLYLPFEISKNQLEDLGVALKESDILCTVFNEDYSLVQSAQSKVLKVMSNTGKEQINIYCLDVESDIRIENKYDGTLISFSRPEALKDSNDIEYYRFRINSIKLNCIIKKYSPKNIFLQSAFSVQEAIDFRFNDYRSLPLSLVEEIRKGNGYKIGKVHFLLITEADVDLDFCSVSPSARELEYNVWKKYYKKLGNKKVVAYHWKVKSENNEKLIENCIMFVKNKVHKCNFLTIGLYLFIAGGLAVLFNFISNLLF